MTRDENIDYYVSQVSLIRKVAFDENLTSARHTATNYEEVLNQRLSRHIKDEIYYAVKAKANELVEDSKKASIKLRDAELDAEAKNNFDTYLKYRISNISNLIKTRKDDYWRYPREVAEGLDNILAQNKQDKWADNFRKEQLSIKSVKELNLLVEKVSLLILSDVEKEKRIQNEKWHKLWIEIRDKEQQKQQKEYQERHEKTIEEENQKKLQIEIAEKNRVKKCQERCKKELNKSRVHQTMILLLLLFSIVITYIDSKHSSTHAIHDTHHYKYSKQLKNSYRFTLSILGLGAFVSIVRLVKLLNEK